MEIRDTELPGVRVITLDVHRDDRGEFAETYDRAEFARLGVPDEFVHDSYNRSSRAGTVRGFHFQLPPRSQAKLVRVARGSVFDVIVDVRSTSSAFGRHITVRLDAAGAEVIYLPHGFAHAFCTLEDDTVVTYKMSDHFSSDHYAGVRWDDPALAVEWPVAAGEAVVSERDRGLPALREAGLDDLDWPGGGGA